MVVPPAEVPLLGEIEVKVGVEVLA
jgi:hypothetical protein